VTGDDPRYGEQVRLRMARLTGVGALLRAPDVVTGRGGDREQGAEVVLQLRVTDGKVTEARFRAFGCPHFIAAASWLTEWLCGAGREDLERWDWRPVAAALEVPAAKFGRLLTLQDALRDAAGNWPGGATSTV
jgi:NifU-like protein involved in Fe-S cluster formation